METVIFRLFNRGLKDSVNWTENSMNMGQNPGFNLHCRLDIYFDDSLDFDIFNDIKQVLKQYIDLAEYKKYYTSQTGLKEKIDKIGILSALLSSGDKALLHPLLLSIRDDYPATGTYFYDEATAYLDVLDKNENST